MIFGQHDGQLELLACRSRFFDMSCSVRCSITCIAWRVFSGVLLNVVGHGRGQVGMPEQTLRGVGIFHLVRDGSADAPAQSVERGPLDLLCLEGRDDMDAGQIIQTQGPVLQPAQNPARLRVAI